MSVRVYDATTQMLGRLFEIEKQSFKEEAFSKPQVAYLLEDLASISLVARVDEGITGFVIGRLELSTEGVAGHVMTIEVVPDFRRRGIATLLMLEIESRFRKRGAVESKLEVREENAAARGLYRKLEYVETASLIGYYGLTHGLYLCKALGKIHP